MTKSTKELKKTLAKNSVWSLIYSISSKIGALIFAVILARFLMPENYGNYSIIVSTVMILHTLADMGINNALIKYLSQAVSKEKKKISAYYRYLLKLKLLLTITISLVLLAIAYPLSFYFFKNEVLFLPFLLAAFYIFVLAMESFHVGILFALEKIKYVTYKETISQILRISLVFLVFYFIAESNHLLFIFIVLIVTHVLAVIYILFSVRKTYPDIYFPSKQELNKAKIRKFVSYLTITYVSGIFFSYLDSLVLGYFFLSEFVGFYRASFNLIVGVTGFMAFPNLLLLPLFTKANRSNSKKVLENLFKYLIIISVPAAFGLFVLGKHFLVLFYGHTYLSSFLSLSFLCFLIPLMTLIAIMIPLFSAKDRPQILAKILVLTTLLNIILDIIFARFFIDNPLFATGGVALATLISWGFYFTAIFVLTKKLFNKDLSLKLFIKPLAASIVMAGLLVYILGFIQDITIFSGVGIVFLGILIYFTTLFLFRGLTKKDLELFLSFVR